MGEELAFGCPECGRKVTLDRRSSGRRVRCRRCDTLIEVPFFPRQFGRRRSRRPRWRAWLMIGLVAAVVVGSPAAAWQWWRWSVHAGQADELRRAMAMLDEAERCGDVSSAFLAAEEARSLASRSGAEPPGGLGRLTARRDAIARQDVETKLGALAALPPDRAFEESRAIEARVASDPALSSLAGRSASASAEAAGRWVDHHLDCAGSAAEAGRPGEAMAIAERVASGLDGLPGPRAAALRERARAFAAVLVERLGAQVGPIALCPDPWIGDASSTGSEIIPPMAEALVERGYLLPAPGATLADLWSRAPMRLRATIDEQPGVGYLQSPHRTSRISVDLVLDRDGQPVWHEHIEARTRVPLPGLSALEASRFALGDEPNPEVERRLHRDARANLLEKLPLKLGSLPPAPAAGDGRQDGPSSPDG